ncbi:uncharacterized protein PpBr36_10249 [Pyricularia pennisetigena]|uniref:uncharacterized protein n=1 Tax=Pyricularia pennisetigena TaxID=1578925 RepID=UPI001151B538|nr:uncharacterized protein PpBr36_10249 [Pyricularia pennisetigena]TLS21389.1 hypothetical protein PpBr36_10249 [Pyricularia pennisetigena]
MLRVGHVLKGARATYELQQVLKGNTVFEARILSPISLDETWSHYQIPHITASPYVRQMHETIGSFEDPGSNPEVITGNQPCLCV